MSMKVIIGAVVLVLGLSSATLADFKTAVEAFQEGDYDAALTEFKSLAAAGNNAAQYNIGVMYELGYGVEQNPVEAARWYLRAAHQGHVEAQFNLGSMYANGEGVKQELVMAFKWLDLAANLGHAEAPQSRDAVAGLLDENQLASAQKLVKVWMDNWQEQQ